MIKEKPLNLLKKFAYLLMKRQKISVDSFHGCVKI